MPIKVLVSKRPDSPYFLLYYKDPKTGRRKAKSSGTNVRRKADAMAEAWQQELNEGLAVGTCTWDKFSTRFADEYLAGKPNRTVQSYRKAMASFTTRMGGTRTIGQIDAAVMSEFQAKLRKDGMADATIASDLRHLRAAFAWAVKIGLLHKVPHVTYPKLDRRNLSRGRPLSDDEFSKFKAALATIAGDDAPLWIRFADGLWLSGLRITEAIRFSWDAPPIRIDMDGGQYPRLVIFAEGQKSRRDQTLPITPDFAEFLRRTPPSDRTGLVFPLKIGTRKKVNSFLAGRTLSEAGRASNVVVSDDGKFASAHDLRRSFGTRWAIKVVPALLQLLMRHKSIATTMAYYVGINADVASAELWAVNQSVNNPEHPSKKAE